jgi:hypothetical protein
MEHEKSNAIQRQVDSASGEGPVGQMMAPPKFSLSSGDAPVQRAVDPHTLGLAGHANALHEAMDGLGTDEDAVYRALRQACAFDAAKAKELRAVFRALHSGDLVVWLEDDLSGGELAAALIYAGYYPSPGTVLGSFQSSRAREIMLDMSGGTLAAYTRIIENASNGTEREWIHKALAAGRSVADIATFANRIRGQSNDWMRDHLQLSNSTGGRGMQQQWNDSCGPTTAQTVRGQLDPIYALQVHDQNPNIYTDLGATGAPANAPAAAEQRTMLQNNGGVAVNRGAAGGQGSSLGDYLGDQTPNLGTNYRIRSVADLGGAGAACDEMNRHLDRGLPVAIRVSSGGASGHFATVISRSGNTYNIQDPWNGNMLQHTRNDFINNTLNIALWNQLSHIYVP